MKKIIITVEDLSPVVEMVMCDMEQDALIDKPAIARRLNSMINTILNTTPNDEDHPLSRQWFRDLIERELDAESMPEEDRKEAFSLAAFFCPEHYLMYKLSQAAEQHPLLRHQRHRIRSIQVIDPSGDVLLHLL